MKRSQLRVLKFTSGAGILLAITVLALWGMFQSAPMNLPLRMQSPSLGHPMGLEQNGSDLLVLVAQGAFLSIKVASIVVLISTSFGLAIGTLSGWWGGVVDIVVMRVTEVFMAFPGFLLNLFLVSCLGPSVPHLIFALSVTSWTSFARVARAEVMHIKTLDQIQAATAIGASPLRIVFFHILPNISQYILLQMTLAASSTVLAESALSYLGLGAPISTPSWGSLLNSGRKVLDLAPHISLFPALAIFLLVLSMNLISQGLDRSAR